MSRIADRVVTDSAVQGWLAGCETLETAAWI
jgi:hypothetical protein